MKKVEVLPVCSLQPGMLVGTAVADDAGRILLPAGAVLSDSSIASLQRRGIESVGIELEVVEDAGQAEERRQEVARQLDHIFRHAGREGDVKALYDVIAKYRMEQGA